MTINITKQQTLFRIFFTNFLDMLAFGMFLPILPFLFSTDETGIFKEFYSLEMLTLIYGLLIGIVGIGAFLGAPLLGALSDRVGRKKILLLANAVNVVTYSLLALGVGWASLFIIFIARILGGFFGNTNMIVQSCIADVSEEDEKAKNFGITGIAFGLGFVVGVLIVVLLSPFSWFSYPLVMMIAAFLNVVNMGYLWFYMPETLGTSTNKPIYLWTGLDNVRKAFGQEQYRLMFMVIFMLTIAFTFFSQFFQYYLIEQFGFDVEQVGQVFMFVGILIALTQGVFIRPISDRFSPVQVLNVTIVMLAISYLLLLIPNSVLGLYMVIPVFIFFQGITFPTTLAIVSNLANKKVQGEVIGINQSVQALANAIPPILFGFAVGMKVSFPMWFGAVCTFGAWAIFNQFKAVYKRDLAIEKEGVVAP